MSYWAILDLIRRRINYIESNLAKNNTTTLRRKREWNAELKGLNILRKCIEENHLLEEEF